MIKIILPNKRYNAGIRNLGEDLTKEELEEICYLTTGRREYEKVLDNNWSTGRFVKVINGDEVNFVGISGRNVGGRNSFVQTIATIFSSFINSPENNKKLHYYFLRISGNNLTDYLKFCYRLMITMKFNFINPNVGFGRLRLEPFNNVEKLINERNIIRDLNSSNKSSFITDEGAEYRIYGKSFGANSKETSLICFAISMITDKPVKLFQILDNNSESLSENDKNAISRFGKINIIDDTFMFEEVRELPEDNDNIRSARFTYNLLSKFGKKKCAFCDCEISNLISGAHIWPVANIKKERISIEDKKNYASDPNNGIWLCENHHKLFDAHLLTVDEEGRIIFSDKLNEICLGYAKYITTISNISMNTEMKKYFKLRYK